MVNYRFIFLSPIRAVMGEHILQAASDAEALELARLLSYPFGINILQGLRSVGTVPPARHRGVA